VWVTKITGNLIVFLFYSLFT